MNCVCQQISTVQYKLYKGICTKKKDNALIKKRMLGAVLFQHILKFVQLNCRCFVNSIQFVVLQYSALMLNNSECVCESMYARMHKQALHLCVVWCDFWGAHTHKFTTTKPRGYPSSRPKRWSSNRTAWFLDHLTGLFISLHLYPLCHLHPPSLPLSLSCWLA